MEQVDEWSGTEKKLAEPLRGIYDEYAAGVTYIAVVHTDGSEGIGTCFHIGDGVFITARHVVDGVRIKAIGAGAGKFQGPYFHPDEKVDVAALVIPDFKGPILPLGSHLDDWLGDDFLLTDTVVLGYPPIPLVAGPHIFAAKGEVNATIDRYIGGHPHFIMSMMPRGGFSGGPAICSYGFVLGVVTQSLVSNSQPAELGFLAVLSVEGIFGCIAHHKIVPKNIDDDWDGFWNKQSTFFSQTEWDHVVVDLYTGHKGYYIEISSFRKDILENVIKLLDKSTPGQYQLEWRHEQMFKAIFAPSITDRQANKIYQDIIAHVGELGIPRFGGRNNA